MYPTTVTARLVHHASDETRAPLCGRIIHNPVYVERSPNCIDCLKLYPRDAR